MPELVNYHQMPWRYAMHYGRAKVVAGFILAAFDTVLSGLALVSIIVFVTTGGVDTLWRWVTFIGGFLFAAVIYLVAQYITFLASGHPETIAASRGDRGLFGPRARKAANSTFIQWLTHYDVVLSLACVGYMILTDFVGIAQWIWHGGIPWTDLPKLFIGILINIAIVALTFGNAYTGVQKGMRIMEYAYHEQERDLGEAEAAREAARKSGYNVSAIGGSTPSFPARSTGGRSQPSIGSGRGTPPKALPPGNTRRPVTQQTTMHLAQQEESNEWDNDEDDEEETIRFNRGYPKMPPLPKRRA